MTVPETIYARVKAAGFTTEAACALLAQIQKESLFKPNNLEDSRNQRLGMTDEQYTQAVDNGSYTSFANDAAGYGIAQWTDGSRKRNYINYFRARGKSIADLETQISFLLWEMKAYFGGIWKKCLTSHDLKDLTWVLLDTWENPAEKTKNMVERYGYAQEWFKKFQNQNESIEGKEAKGMTKSEAIQKVLDLARSEIGYHEKASNSGLNDKDTNAGGANYTKYAQELDSMTNWYNGPKNGYAWCDIFVDWLFYKSFGPNVGREMICQPTSSAGAGCLYSAQYYKSKGCWHNSTPQPGDQIFFTYSPGEYSHTGIVESVSGGMVVTIEGNTSDQVGRRSYGEGSANIAGYGRPRWELAANESGSDNIIPSPYTPSYELLRKGNRGETVMELQQKLIEAGYDVGPDGADGDFGMNTEKAVIKFQTDNNLEVDGIVGSETWAALEKETKKEKRIESEHKDAAPAAEDDESVPRAKLILPVLKEDDEGIEGYYVKLAQAALGCWGYTIVVHGIFGNEMTQKVRDFQKKKGLEPDGIIGPETWKALLEV